jgi:hypothetical protein
MSLLSKKSPNDAVNIFKLKFLNTLLDQANQLLGSAYRPFTDFERFDQDNVPQNSDVVFILAQYLQCFEKLRADNVVVRGGHWQWVIEAKSDPEADEVGRVYVRTVRPKKLRE